MSKSHRKKSGRVLPTPIREALLADSPLLSMVKDGLGAVIGEHRVYFDESVRTAFADSLDIDSGLREGREQENRWDYLLGHEPSRRIVGTEPHSAENGEISTVMRKLAAARRQLREHMCEDIQVSKWIWVASGKVQFLPFEKASLRLAQSGIQFVGRKLMNKHLS